MPYLPAISERGRRLIVAFSTLLAAILFFSISLDPQIRKWHYWRYIQGVPLLYLILLPTFILLSRLGFDQEIRANDELPLRMSFIARIVSGSAVVILFVLPILFLVGMVTLQLFSISWEVSMWILAILSAGAWLIHVSRTMYR